MNQRIIASIVTTLALTSVAVACGADGAEQGASPSDATRPPAEETLPPVTDGYEHPIGADEVVISYAEVGGFVPREFAFRQTPNLLISGDGHVFSPGAQIEIYPGPLLPAVQTQTISEAGVQTLLAAADDAGLLTDIEYEAPTNIADASTAQLTIAANGETYVHEAYALGLASPGTQGEETTPQRQALADLIAQLGDLGTLVGDDELGEQELFEPTSYGIEAVVVDDVSSYGSGEIDPRVVDWPTDVTVRLADATECTPVPAAEVGSLFTDADQLTFFDEGGITYQVLVRPILPGDDCA